MLGIQHLIYHIKSCFKARRQIISKHNYERSEELFPETFCSEISKYVHETTIKLKKSHISVFQFNNIGFTVHQHIHLPPTQTSLENVQTPLFSRRVPSKKVEHANELLSQDRLPDKLESAVILITNDPVLVAEENHVFTKINEANEAVVLANVGVPL